MQLTCLVIAYKIVDFRENVIFGSFHRSVHGGVDGECALEESMCRRSGHGMRRVWGVSVEDGTKTAAEARPRLK